MPSKRLTYKIRSGILKALEAHAFGPKEAELLAEEHEIAKAAYDLKYPPKIQKMMAEFPKDFFDQHKYMHLYVGGEARAYQLAQPMLVGGSEGSPRVTEESALGIRVRVLTQRQKTLKAEKEQAHEAAKGVLKSVATIKRLIEVWPEIESFAQPFENAPPEKKTTALALPLATLNFKFDLPPGEKAAKEKAVIDLDSKNRALRKFAKKAKFT